MPQNSGVGNMKDTLPYFSHDNNASQHPKMKALITEYGFEGYGRFWILNEKIARNSGAYIDISRKVYKLDLANELGFNSKELDDFLVFLSDPEIDLINIKDNIITTDRINELYSVTMEARETARKKHKKEKNDISEEKTDFSEEKDDISEEKLTDNNKTKQNKNKQNNNKENSSGENAGRKKPEKLRLRFREPENDKEYVEKAYWTNWDLLYSQQKVSTEDPRVNWIQCRNLMNSHFDKKITPDQLVCVINKALQDNWILEKGYSLEKILSCSFVNSVINKINFVETKELVVQNPLYNTAIACFEKDQKAKAILYQDDYSKKMQLQCLNEILARCKNIVPDMPEIFFINIMEHFRIMCNGKFKGKWTYTPRCLKTDWIWELVIDSLPENESPELKQIVKGLFK